MSDHFSGDDLTYPVEVTTTNQRTGQQKTGALNSVARNKVTGEWSGSVLTLTGGNATPQDMTLTITATGVDDATASDDFTLSLTSEPVPTPEPTATPTPEPTATPTPEPQGPVLTDEFDDLTMSDDETVDIDMTAHFSGEGLTYEVMVTTTHQRTGQERTGALNEIARNKVTGTWDGSVLTLTAGHASSQELTIEITASNGDGEASGSFTFTLDN